MFLSATLNPNQINKCLILSNFDKDYIICTHEVDPQFFDAYRNSHSFNYAWVFQRCGNTLEQFIALESIPNHSVIPSFILIIRRLKCPEVKEPLLVIKCTVDDQNFQNGKYMSIHVTKDGKLCWILHVLSVSVILTFLTNLRIPA